MDTASDRQSGRRLSLPTPKTTDRNAGRTKRLTPMPSTLRPSLIFPPNQKSEAMGEGKRPSLTPPTPRQIVQQSIAHPEKSKPQPSRPSLPVPSKSKTSQPLILPVTPSVKPSHTSLTPSPTNTTETPPTLNAPVRPHLPTSAPLPIPLSAAPQSLPRLLPPITQSPNSKLNWEVPEPQDWLERYPSIVAPIRHEDI